VLLIPRGEIVDRQDMDSGIALSLTEKGGRAREGENLDRNNDCLRKTCGSIGEYDRLRGAKRLRTPMYAKGATSPQSVAIGEI